VKTLITQDEEVSIFAEHVASIEIQLREIRTGLEEFQQKVRTGDIGSAAEAAKTIGTVRTWIKMAMDAEKSIAERKKTENGITRGGFALDLEEARRDIGCKLARLRRCKDPGGIPG
jgi:hypothetical protein